MRFLDPFLLIFLIYFKKSTVGFIKKLICIREIPELYIDNEKVLSYRIRFPATGVRREVVVAEFTRDVDFAPKFPTLFSIQYC